MRKWPEHELAQRINQLQTLLWEIQDKDNVSSVGGSWRVLEEKLMEIDDPLEIGWQYQSVPDVLISKSEPKEDLGTGKRVRITNLHAWANVQYNDSTGVILGYSNKHGRWKVRCDDDLKVVLLKDTNLKIIPLVNETNTFYWRIRDKKEKNLFRDKQNMFSKGESSESEIDQEEPPQVMVRYIKWPNKSPREEEKLNDEWLKK